MNNSKRKNLLKAITNLKALNIMIQDVLDEEQDGFDRLPENLQNSSLYSSMESAIEDLENATEKLEEAIDYLESASM